jgi:hypothetical protein
MNMNIKLIPKLKFSKDYKLFKMKLSIRDKPSRISRSKHPAQYARKINEKDDEKGTIHKFNQIKFSYHFVDT